MNFTKIKINNPILQKKIIDENIMTEQVTASSVIDEVSSENQTMPHEYEQADFQVIRRNGKVAHFDAGKIAIALTKAFLAVEGTTAADSSRIHEMVATLTNKVVIVLKRRESEGKQIHIEDVQDQVELALMRAGEQKVARTYILYREQQTQKRISEQQAQDNIKESQRINILMPNGVKEPLDINRIKNLILEACEGLEYVNAEKIMDDTCHNLYEGVKQQDVAQVLVMSARTLIEKEPNYSEVAARLLLDVLRHDALTFLNIKLVSQQKEMAKIYPDYFKSYIKRAIKLELLDPKLAEYDLDKLTQALLPERDLSFTYLGLQTLFDRYFIHTEEGIRFELPQAFFMRVAMGLAINEADREAKTIEFYHLLSSFDFMSSTPTLFNSGTLRPQLSSCYLTHVPDDLEGIYNAIKDNALLSKFAGGLGNDWTAVRGLGAHIKGTNGKSQGVVPFLKVANDTAVAVNQCFADDTLVYTENGIKSIKDINIGDLVLGQRGEYRQVTKAMSYKQTDSMVTIDPKHSIMPINVTSGHPLWSLQNVPMEQDNIKPEWVDAGKLQSDDYIGMVIPKEIVVVADFDTDDARLCGILLGNGHCSKEGTEWNLSGNHYIEFIKSYLTQRNIDYSMQNMQISWSITDKTICYNELYDAEDSKHIHRKYSHLPKEQTLALINGLLETEGCISQDNKISFTHTSQSLVYGLRYQLLRLGVPCSGQYSEISKSYDLRIPAIKSIAEPLGCQVLTKQNWIEWQGYIFTRIKSVKELPPTEFVYDLKVEGDPSYMTTNGLAHNGGKRKGAVCAYLESWHIDIEEFLELRKNTGDERRRTHDMNTANWIPDLFMKRVAEEATWTLFSPNETPDLHELYGQAFEQAYIKYEALAKAGKLKLSKEINAVDLWRKMLVFLFETGHPWITFKDPCNIRYTNNHVGVVHSSNLCTEITLHTNSNEIAVCNLGSVNLPAHVDKNGINHEKLQRTIKTAIRMLDNVIDYNFYSVPQAKDSNFRHRPIGLGIMGFQDALFKMKIAYASQEAIDFADQSMEAVSYYTINSSSDLAKERGIYSTFEGSLWSRGILPIDSVKLLEQERGSYIQQDQSTTLDWDHLRQKVVKQGMRNSNCMAIAPTACVSGDTLILSSEGLIPIESLSTGQMQWQNLHLNIVQEGNLALADQLYLNGLKETRRVITKRGSEITATPNHRIRVIDEAGEYSWKYFSELKIGDEVVRRLGGHQALLADKPLIDLIVPKSKRKLKLAKKLTKEVAFIIGLYISTRGHYTKKEGIGFALHNSEGNLLETLRTQFSQWGLTLLAEVSKADSDNTVYLAYSSELVQWLEVNGFNKQQDNFIPNKILESKSEVLCAFLSGLFIADGMVNNDCVEITTVSHQLALQVKFALESLGILTNLSTSKDNRVYISNTESTQLFLEQIGFADSIKQQKLIEGLAGSNARRGHNIRSLVIIEDFIQAARQAKVDKQYLNPLACSKTNGKMNIPLAQQVIALYPELQSTKLAKLLAKGTLYFEPIVAIEASQDITYDLQVPKNHTYVANGFISHNTISNICGVSQSIEPTYQNMYVKSNLSGEFTIVNPYLVHDLKIQGLWDDVMINDLKYYDGCLAPIDRIPQDLKILYATAFEIDPRWLVEAASRRQKWIDQGQSLNLYMEEPSGKKLDNLYKLAWVRGLKTTYYLRSKGATGAEKTSINENKEQLQNTAPKACSIMDPDCDACQ